MTGTEGGLWIEIDLDRIPFERRKRKRLANPVTQIFIFHVDMLVLYLKVLLQGQGNLKCFPDHRMMLRILLIIFPPPPAVPVVTELKTLCGLDERLELLKLVVIVFELLCKLENELEGKYELLLELLELVLVVVVILDTVLLPIEDVGVTV